MNDNVKFAILGAILAGLTQLLAGVLIELFKSAKRRKSEQGNYSLVVRLLLESILKQLDKLKDDLGSRGFFAFATLNSLSANIVRLEPKLASVFESGLQTSAQTDFIAFTIDLQDFTSDVQNLENYRVNEEAKYNQIITELSNQGSNKIKAVAIPDPSSLVKASQEPVSTTKADAETAIDTTRKFVEQQRSTKLVELVDIRRRCNELIDKFRNQT